MRPDRLLQTALFIALSAFMLAPGTTAFADNGPEATGLGIARVSYMTGDVLFTSDVEDEWAEVTPNFPLRDGDRIWVGDDSKMEMRFDSGESAWVNYQSELDMLSLTRGEDGNAYQMGLPFGEASFDVGNFEVLGSVLQVDTPNASVRAFGRAIFRVTSLADGTTQVGVSEGSVEVESENGIANIHSDEMIEVYADGRSRIMDLPPYDDWDDWVDSRLDRYTRSYASTKYLPRGMYSYADEFEEGGRWVSYPEYGHIWVPHVEVGWSPYSNGRWVWQGWHYVWLPYDPWYAPFHYGRWSWTVRYGWCWIPPLPTAVYWSPGYVGWVWDADYVYWVPLAPGEVYYGHGHYGPNSVNVYQTTVIVNKNVYVNSKPRNGVVVVKRDNFLHGKTVRVKEEKVVRKFKEKIVRKEIRKETIIKEEAVYGAPPVKAIKPVKASWAPKPDKVFKADRLPKKVVKREMFEKKRNVVKGKVKSAFSPDKSPGYMKDIERANRPEFKRNGELSKEKRIEKKVDKKERIEKKTGGADETIIKKTTRKEERELRKELRREKRTEKEARPRRDDRPERAPKQEIIEERPAKPSKPKLREVQPEPSAPEGGRVRPERAPREDRTRTREPRGGRDIAPAEPEGGGAGPAMEPARRGQRGEVKRDEPRASREKSKPQRVKKETQDKKKDKDQKKERGDKEQPEEAP